MTENALTWNDLADDYDKMKRGRPARTLPLQTVREWAERQTDKYYVDDDGYIYRKGEMK